MSKYPWTELTQAKWDTRRMRGDIGHDVDSTIFTAAGLDYRTIPVYDAPTFLTDRDAITYIESPALIYERSQPK